MFIVTFRLKEPRWAWIFANVGVIGMNKTLCSQDFLKEKKKGEKAEFCNRNLLCGLCGGWCVNRAPNCVRVLLFFRPEVSFKQARKREMDLSGVLLASSPPFYGSNVNGGLGAIGSDPLNSSAATAPLLFFSIKTAGIFQRVLARWLMCNSSEPHLPPHNVIHRQGSSSCFLQSTLFPS